MAYGYEDLQAGGLDIIEEVALEYLKSVYTKEGAKTAKKKEQIHDLDAAFIAAENFVNYAIGRRNRIRERAK